MLKSNVCFMCHEVLLVSDCPASSLLLHCYQDLANHLILKPCFHSQIRSLSPLPCGETNERKALQGDTENMRAQSRTSSCPSLALVGMGK